MAKRPTAPRPRATPSGTTPGPRATPRRAAPHRHEAPHPESGSSRRTPETTTPKGDRGTRSGSRAGRTAGRSAHEPAETTTASPHGAGSGPDEQPDSRRVVQATERFRSLVAGRPWRRRRRAIIGTLAAVAVLLVAALSAAIWLPALQLQQVTVSGDDYVDQEQVRSSVESRLGHSVLLLPTSAVAEELTEVPGVRSAEVERRWPDGAHVTITERQPLATVERPDGSSAILDEEGVELPPEAGEGATLVPLEVDPASDDPEGATEAMVEVLAGLPDPLRGALDEVSAASRSDVTLNLSLEDGGDKTVVWGDAQDAELKAEVVQVLVSEPGTTIDVSSPVAPVTR